MGKDAQISDHRQQYRTGRRNRVVIIGRNIEWNDESRFRLTLPQGQGLFSQHDPHYTCRMIRAFKTFFLWLLIASLPVQGMAAAMKSSCAEEHHATASATEMPAMAEHHHAQMTAHHQHADGMHMASADAPVEQPHATDHKLKSSVCSSCASCCLGASAPPSVTVLTPVYDSAEFVIASPSPLLASFIPAGLERPPKSLSV
jgi:hypothetical protein